MSESSGLLVAMSLAERQRDAAAQQLGRVRQGRQQAVAQLEQLTGYASDTEQRWMLRGQVGLDPAVMHHHLMFMRRLDQTIAMQRDIMANHERAVAESERQLLQAELKLKSLQQIIERRRRQVALLQVRREQKETDELAATRHRIRAQSGPQEFEA